MVIFITLSLYPVMTLPYCELMLTPIIRVTIAAGSAPDTPITRFSLISGFSLSENYVGSAPPHYKNIGSTPGLRNFTEQIRQSRQQL